MPKTITQLTDEQRARFPEWVEKWVAIGHCTAPADRVRAEWGIRGCYEAAGLKPPPIVWVDSPLAAVLAGPLTSVVLDVLTGVNKSQFIADIGVQFRNLVAGVSENAARKALSREVQSTVFSAVDSAVRSAVSSEVHSEVVSAVSSAVRSEVDSAVSSEVHSEVRSEVDLAVHSAVNLAVGSAVGSAVAGVPAVLRKEVHAAICSAVEQQGELPLYRLIANALQAGATAVVKGSPVAEALRNLSFRVSDAQIVSAEVDSDVRAAVFGNVWEEVRAQLEPVLLHGVVAAVRRQLPVAAADGTLPAISTRADAALRQYWNKYLGGQYWAAWQSYQSFLREVCGLELKPELEAAAVAYQATTESCGWWWPGRDYCFVSDRPLSLHMAEGPSGQRLHNETGPSLAFRDGWQLWHIDGVEVDEQIVLRPETQTLRQIQEETNVEVRRIRIERFGWKRYLKEVGAVVIDQRRNDIEATHEALMRTPGNNGETVLVCGCPSTARVFALRVPGTVTTCAEAQGRLSGGLSGRIVNRA